MSVESVAESVRQLETEEYSTVIRRSNELLRHPPTVTVLEKKLVVAFAIIPFSIAGALIRIVLQRLQTYEGAPVFALVYAQWVGCLVMGIVTFHKENLFFFYHPFQVALATGLCGSITTFSSWQLGIFDAFANVAGADHSRGKNILDALSQLLVTFAMSFSGYQFGQHIGRWLNHVRLSTGAVQRKVMNKSTQDGKQQHELARHQTPVLNLQPHGFSVSGLRWIDYVVIVFGIISWVAVIVAAILAPLDQRQLALSCVFAPVGALLRWYLSFYNGLRSDFFIGTFWANILGTIVLAIISLLRSGVAVSPLPCIVLGALADGFCGCLTTISTFVVEISILPCRQAYTYSIVSVVLGQCFMFVIIGPYIWTQGLGHGC